RREHHDVVPGHAGRRRRGGARARRDRRDGVRGELRDERVLGDEVVRANGRGRHARRLEVPRRGRRAHLRDEGVLRREAGDAVEVGRGRGGRGGRGRGRRRGRRGGGR